MEWLNYHHLHYFHVVAREGSVTAACAVLHLSQPTVSEQLRQLERFFGGALFARVGRGLVLTELGQTVYRYSQEIFSLGEELVDTVRGQPIGQPIRLRVGIVDVVPKLMARKFISPVLASGQPFRIICREGTLERLLADLVIHQLDVVLSDEPVPNSLRTRVYTHRLGECGVSILAAPSLAKRHKGDFPNCLQGAPMIMPTAEHDLRRSLDDWLAQKQLRVDIRCECEDSSLLMTLGQSGEGFFAVPTAIEQEVCHEFEVRMIGRISDLREAFFAITPERKIKHPGVALMCSNTASLV